MTQEDRPMDPLTELMARALHESTLLGSEDGAEEWAPLLLAAIDPAEADWLRAGLLLGEVARSGWDVQVYGPHTTGDDWTVGVRLMSEEWRESTGTTLLSALTDLLAKLRVQP